MADVTDSCSGSLCSISTVVKKLVKKQRGNIETTRKSDVEAIDDFLRIIDSMPGRPGPSS